MQIEFTIDGDPQGQGLRKIAQSFQRAYMGKPLTKPLKITIRAVFGVPRSYSKARAKACLEGLEWPTKKLDTYKVEKGIYDALSGLAYEDGRQIVKCG